MQSQLRLQLISARTTYHCGCVSASAGRYTVCEAPTHVCKVPKRLHSAIDRPTKPTVLPDTQHHALRYLFHLRAQQIECRKASAASCNPGGSRQPSAALPARPLARRLL